MDESKLRGVQFVRLIWCDCAGIRRCRVIPYRKLQDILSAGVGLANACLFLPSWGDCPPPDPAANPVGEIRMVPDVSTIHRLPWRFSQAMVLVTMHHPQPDSPAWECCPRSILQRVLEKASTEHGITIKVGFELEFILLQASAASVGEMPPPIDLSVYCQTSAFDKASPVLEDICIKLSELGIKVDQLHPESAFGQFELALSHEDAFHAADNVILAKETIQALAAEKGMKVSFLPKVFPNQAGNGGHCHFSIWRDDQNIISDGTHAEKLSAFGSCFLAGILKHLPALMCFTTPSHNSYSRIGPSTWSGAYQCWGINNREAPLRMLFPPGGPEAANCELKSFDCTANPHLGLAAMIMAGLMGVYYDDTLPEPVGYDPATLTDEERELKGIKRLPATLADALVAVKADPLYIKMLEDGFQSKDLVRAYVAVKESEWLFFHGMKFADEVDMLHERY